MVIFKKIANKILKNFMVSSIETHERIVYLTFDDGPEPGISEYVLETLAEYGFKATFFCKGDNAEKFPDLIKKNSC